MESDDLFARESPPAIPGEERSTDEPLAHAPLAARLRPRSIDDFVGQQHLLADDQPLGRFFASQGAPLHSMILWGPPGVGKTTLARLLAAHSGCHWIALSAVLAGIKDVRGAIDEARAMQMQGRQTVLFIDEVHRFNKAQQDGFLPHVENGTVRFIGATTENPSFEVNSALLSRARVYVLKRLTGDDLALLAERALALAGRACTNDGRDLLLRAADGDGRRLLNLIEIADQLAGEGAIDAAAAGAAAGDGQRQFDKGGDAFFDQISALHKAVRGSAPDAALYWLCRMLDGGADPAYVARRVVRMASEDIGNADPRGLQLALAAWDTYTRLGSPEGELALAQAVLYLACVPKSNAAYVAFNAAMAEVRAGESLPVPEHLRNAPTALAKSLGHGEHYRYAHDEADGYAAGETYFPEALGERRYYAPLDRGLEAKIAQRLATLRARDASVRGAPDDQA
ncbi:MAG: replication-associated recombination protein A [Pseudomonadota bacterium]